MCNVYRCFVSYGLGMLKRDFLENRFWLLKTGFKPVFGFTNLHKKYIII